MILIALGANLESVIGAPLATLTACLGAMADHNIRVLNVSNYYQTPAWPDPSDPPYVNAVAEIRTPLGPAALLDALHRIEADFGRLRTYANAPRTLDLDLIDYDSRIETGPPILPHPRVSERAFVLQPLADVAPHWVHPILKCDVKDMLAALPQAEVAAVVPLKA